MLILYLKIGVFKSRKCLSPKRALKTRTAATKWPREEEKPESTIYRKWSERCVVKTVKTAGIIRRRRCVARGVRGEGSCGGRCMCIELRRVMTGSAAGERERASEEQKETESATWWGARGAPPSCQLYNNAHSRSQLILTLNSCCITLSHVSRTDRTT